MLTEERVPGMETRRERRRELRTRLQRRRASHSYVMVLLLILANFVFMAAAPDEQWAYVVLLLLGCLTLTAAAWASGLTAGQGPPLVVIALATTALAFLDLAVGSRAFTGTGWLAAVLLLVATSFAIGVGVIDQGEVNAQSVLGAVCIYVLIGLIFTEVYGAVAVLGDGNLFAQPAGDGTTSLRLYFSYVTIATLGYGDLTPVSAVARTLAISEALLGQLYLVTVVAILVGRIGRVRKD